MAACTTPAAPDLGKAAAIPSIQGTPLVSWIIQGDTLVASVIFQAYYFMRKVINYTSDTGLVSSGPCGLNLRQILRH